MKYVKTKRERQINVDIAKLLFLKTIVVERQLFTVARVLMFVFVYCDTLVLSLIFLIKLYSERHRFSRSF